MKFPYLIIRQSKIIPLRARWDFPRLEFFASVDSFSVSLATQRREIGYHGSGARRKCEDLNECKTILIVYRCLIAAKFSMTEIDFKLNRKLVTSETSMNRWWVFLSVERICISTQCPTKWFLIISKRLFVCNVKAIIKVSANVFAWRLSVSDFACFLCEEIETSRVLLSSSDSSLLSQGKIKL